MKEQDHGVWIGEKDLTNDPGFIEISQKEFADLPESNTFSEAVEKVSGNRRDFLKFLGFGIGAATVAAGCDIPVKRAIPYVVKPDSIVPGVATYYATSFVEGGDYAPILVKTREGRPIKIEGNDLSQMSNGGTSSRAQASVLSLYDDSRFKKPMLSDDGSLVASSWDVIDNKAKEILSNSSNVRLVSNTILSPSTFAAIELLKQRYPSLQHIQYDSVSNAAMLDANKEVYGERIIPNYDFAKADVIVAFDADFLGTWVSPTEYSIAYGKNRSINNVNKAKMSRHIQVEGSMSLTGSNADNRILVKPSEQGAAIVTLYNYVTGGSLVSPDLNQKAKKALQKAAQELRSARGRSLVVCGTNNKAEHMLVAAINNHLGNIGSTVKLDHVSLQRKGDDKKMEAFINECKNGAVDTVIFMNCNPVYDYSGAGDIAAILGKVKNSLGVAYANNETVNTSALVAPTHHYLESWGDAEPKRGVYSLLQPTISPLFDTRQASQTLLVWADAAKGDYVDFVKKNWRNTTFPNQSKFSGFDTFWNSVLHNGVFENSNVRSSASFQGISSGIASEVTKTSKSGLEIQLIETSNIGNGAYTNNPWLVEMPDPVTRTSWGNYLSIPVDFDGFRTLKGLNNLEDGDLVNVTLNGQTVTVPVFKNFGQMDGTVSLCLGYGRKTIGYAGRNVGVNVNPWVSIKDGYRTYHQPNVEVSGKVGEEDHFSCVQYHHSYGLKDTDSSTGELINADEAALVEFDYGLGIQGYQGSLVDRSVMFYSSLDDLKENVDVLHKKRAHYQHLNEQQIYNGHDKEYALGHHWGMHIDLNSCFGCGACTISCMAENNIPVVGKKEVSRHHEMTWLRIDRYFYGTLDNPNVVYQPMMCQHCDNAPCENVCPVNATSHSTEGLNQMTYNRCVGTRYCANNCPYKVRRFNWLDYTTADLFPINQPKINNEDQAFGTTDLVRMVLNPDVTVRVRGVIEKCSFCVQRIQEGKLTAKTEGRQLRDSDVKTACQTACPTDAITFGDLNNKKGKLNEKLDNPLNYIALEEVNVRSSVTYTMRVNNKNKQLDA